MIVLSGAELVLPDRILTPGTIAIENGRIADIRPGGAQGRTSGGHSPFAFHGHYIVPGFIDVHVHGVDGFDSLDGDAAVRAIAARLPRYGVTAFCPTTVACTPDALRLVLDQVRSARETPEPRGARVLPAHLESNFINPEFRGAQPFGCLRSPRAALDADGRADRAGRAGGVEEFPASDILLEIERRAPDVGIVTIAPELDGGLDLVRWLVARGPRVSLGHSNATYEEALEAIAAGARQATHLFNRMPPLGHRAPGLAGAILQTDDVAAELICDGFHVHPAMMRMAIAAKRPSRVMAITDGTAASGLPVGRRAHLGGQTITVGEPAAFLDDGTLAGSVLTMDRAFQLLVGRIGLSPVDAATLCSTTPARELGLVGHGVLAPDAVADLVVLDAQFSVVQTYIGGQLVYRDNPDPEHGPTPLRLSLGRSFTTMAESIRLRSLAAAAVLASLVAGPGCIVIGGDQARYVEREDKKFAVTGKPDVSLSTFDGAIEIRTSDRPEVTVTIEKRAYSKESASRIDVQARQDGNHIVVDVKMPKVAHLFAFGFSSASAKLIVTMPASADVHANSGDGAIDVEHVNGALELRSGDGGIDGRDLTGTLTVHTGDGSIKLERIAGAIDADTGDGSVTADGAFKSVQVRTGDGGVTIRAAAGSATDADWSITTGDGSVRLDLPDAFGAELDAHTGDGSINMHDVTLSNVSGEIGKSSVRGRLGAGGHAVKLRTGDGSISLRRN